MLEGYPGSGDLLYCTLASRPLYRHKYQQLDQEGVLPSKVSLSSIVAPPTPEIGLRRSARRALVARDAQRFPPSEKHSRSATYWYLYRPYQEAASSFANLMRNHGPQHGKQMLHGPGPGRTDEERGS